jgi:hypothetical protein
VFACEDCCSDGKLGAPVRDVLLRLGASSSPQRGREKPVSLGCLAAPMPPLVACAKPGPRLAASGPSGKAIERVTRCKRPQFAEPCLIEKLRLRYETRVVAGPAPGFRLSIFARIPTVAALLQNGDDLRIVPCDNTQPVRLTSRGFMQDRQRVLSVERLPQQLDNGVSVGESGMACAVVERSSEGEIKKLGPLIAVLNPWNLRLRAGPRK